ncbi:MULTISPECIES: hypothetical protein [Cysteiniphilum]|uniref:hypothetical protein n=1 Tax=Cysteiniphilum TaxID=2056696 RepID=UPI00177D49BD|nr:MULTISPECIES: hypothetical protein [Cysteiniphilum]
MNNAQIMMLFILICFMPSSLIVAVPQLNYTANNGFYWNTPTVPQILVEKQVTVAKAEVCDSNDQFSAKPIVIKNTSNLHMPSNSHNLQEASRSVIPNLTDYPDGIETTSDGYKVTNWKLFSLNASTVSYNQCSIVNRMPDLCLTQLTLSYPKGSNPFYFGFGYRIPSGQSCKNNTIRVDLAVFAQRLGKPTSNGGNDTYGFCNCGSPINGFEFYTSSKQNTSKKLVATANIDLITQGISPTRKCSITTSITANLGGSQTGNALTVNLSVANLKTIFSGNQLTAGTIQINNSCDNLIDTRDTAISNQLLRQAGFDDATGVLNLLSQSNANGFPVGTIAPFGLEFTDNNDKLILPGTYINTRATPSGQTSLTWTTTINAVLVKNPASPITHLVDVSGVSYEGSLNIWLGFQ